LEKKANGHLEKLDQFFSVPSFFLKGSQFRIRFCRFFTQKDNPDDILESL